MKKTPKPKPLSMEIVEMTTEQLKPFAGNPRRISDEAYAGLKESISRWGMIQPIVWNQSTQRIVGGHQRLRILLEKGVEATPVVVVDIPDETEEKALNVALNNPRIQGQFSAELQEILDEIENAMPDVYDLLNMPAISFDGEIEEPEEEDPTLEIEIPEMELLPFESYDYVVIISRDRMDFEWLCEKFGLKQVNASKIPSRKKIGLGRVVDAKTAIKILQGGSE